MPSIAGDYSFDGYIASAPVDTESGVLPAGDGTDDFS